MDKLARGAQEWGIALSPQQLGLFELYYRELVDWSQRLNLTAIRDYEEVQTRHFLDSLSVALALSPEAQRVIDIGTGAGFPGLPLKILRPQLEVVLLDSVAKKTAFLRHLMGRLGLSGVEVVTARSEELAHQPSFREGFDAVLSRALAPLTTLAELALPFARIGGAFIAQKKGEIAQEVAEAVSAIESLGGKLREVKEFSGEGLGQRFLIIIDKVSPTPDKYPRRPGIPAKRPLR